MRSRPPTNTTANSGASTTQTPGRRPWPAPAGTLRALERHGLMTVARVLNKDGLPTDVWEITQAGKDALDPPARHRQESKKWLGVKGHNSTRFMQFGVWKDATFPDADKEVDPAYLKPGGRRGRGSIIGRRRRRGSWLPGWSANYGAANTGGQHEHPAIPPKERQSMMAESLPLSGESVAWMQRLAREHERGQEWVSFAKVAPSECFRPLLWMGLVEQDDISFRLTGDGWWALANVIEDVDA
jgi:hypothetical protein